MTTVMLQDTQMTKHPKKLVVEYDVTGLDADEVGDLELEATAQGEASDGMGGKRYDGVTGHPDTPVIGSRVTKIGKRSVLVVEYDVSGLTKIEIAYLASEAEVQSERSNGHPSVDVTSRVVVP